SYINAMAEVCEAVDADVDVLAQALALDERIGGRFLRPGLGFCGGCLPKDIRAIQHRPQEIGAGAAVRFLDVVDAINALRRPRTVELVRVLAGGALLGTRVAALGAAFKPNSDDVRDSPALDVAHRLQLEGADVVVYDPEAAENAHRVHPNLRISATLDGALDGSHVTVLLTEWDEFRTVPPEALGALVARRRVGGGTRRPRRPGSPRAGRSRGGRGPRRHGRRRPGPRILGPGRRPLCFSCFSVAPSVPPGFPFCAPCVPFCVSCVPFCVPFCVPVAGVVPGPHPCSGGSRRSGPGSRRSGPGSRRSGP